MLKFFRRKKGNGTSPTTPDESNSSISEISEDPSSEKPLTPESTPEEVPLEPLTAISVPLETPEKPLSENKPSWFSRLKGALTRTRANFAQGIADLFLGKKEIDDSLLENIETRLLMADVGVEATKQIIENLTKGISRKEIKDPQAVLNALQQGLTEILKPCEKALSLHPNTLPFVILMIGVNGAGKTTTIGKLAKKFQSAGHSVMLAAGDTFRAAAIEQLQVWGERNKVPVLAQHTGADSASVIFDAFQSAKAKGTQILIADTAGRLHTRDNLMDELKKVKRVIQKLDPQAPHEILLVLDATTGQNALNQAIKFHQEMGVTGLVVTKLDGTAKGGIIFAIAKKLGLPIRFIGVGEKVDDLRPFEASAFVTALFEGESPEASSEE